MTKDNKTTTTIRRKKGKQFVEALQKIREENATPPSPFFSSEEEETSADVADECYLFHEEVLGPSVLRRLMSRDHSLFLALVVIRCANALLIQTQFVPDEYWQSLEVSHHMVFGYGYKTWEWREGLRGYSYPLVFAFFYKVLHIFGLDSRLALIKVPRILQAIIAAYGDMRLYKLSCQLSGRSTAQWTILCQVLSWFTIYSSTRTLSNSTETVLVISALSFFPWPGSKRKRNDLYRFLTFAALSVIIRPTAALIWILVCSWHLQKTYGTKKISSIIKAYLIVGLVSLGCSAVIDRIWYEKWIFIQLNFLRFNVLDGNANIYGVHPWYWYLTQGLPVVLGSHIFPFLIGMWKSQNKVLLWIIVWIVAIHSFLPHKEFRFILPVLPLAMHYCGEYFQQLCKSPSSEREQEKQINEGGKDTEPVEPENMEAKHCISNDGDKFSEKPNEAEISRKDESKKKLKPEDFATKRHKENLSKARYLIILLVVTNAIPAMYFCLIHQRGTVMVTKYLSDVAENNLKTDVLFLMPCHSTPFYSYLHQNISMRFLTCEPNLNGVSNYTEEADEFFTNPESWLLREYTNAKRELPTHVVMFNTVHKTIISWLTQGGYRLCEQFFHTHIPEGRVGSSVLVSCR